MLRDQPAAMAMTLVRFDGDGQLAIGVGAPGNDGIRNCALEVKCAHNRDGKENQSDLPGDRCAIHGVYGVECKGSK